MKIQLDYTTPQFKHNQQTITYLCNRLINRDRR
jgi:hypothetical protein